jgi:hypothetical protein
MKLKSKLIAMAAAFALLTVGTVVAPANAATQKLFYFISGECLENYEEFGEYALWEEWGESCTLEVKVSPKSNVRTAHLQYWSESRNKWITEASGKTNRSGSLKLNIESYCDGDTWCDGTYTYRIYVLKKGSLKAGYSNEFEVTFYPYTGE